MKTLVVCDLSWLMYRSMYSYTADRFFYYDEGVRKPTGHIFGVLRSIVTLRQKYNNPDIILCRDGLPKDRIELLGGTITENEDGSLSVDRGEYKTGRAPASYNVHKDAQLICDIASTMPGVYYAYDRFKESDDLLFSLAKLNKDRYTRVLIFSGDNDLLQAIDDNIFVLRSMTKDGVLLDDYYCQMESEFKVPAKALPIYRALRGDVSDTIEGVYPRLSKDFARYVATNFDTIEDIKWHLPDPKGEWFKWWQRIQTPNALKILERNYKLMKLNVFPVNIHKSAISLDEACITLANLRMDGYAAVWRRSAR